MSVVCMIIALLATFMMILEAAASMLNPKEIVKQQQIFRIIIWSLIAILYSVLWITP